MSPTASCNDPDLLESQSRRMAAQAALSELKLARLRSELVDRAGAERGASETNRLLLRRIVDQFPSRHAAELAAITDPWQAECRLRELMRSALTSLSMEARNMANRRDG